MERAFSSRHPVPIAADGVYLAVVGQNSVRMGEFPGTEGVRAETRMHHREVRLEVAVGQVQVEAVDLFGLEHALVDDSARRERRNVPLRPQFIRSVGLSFG